MRRDRVVTAGLLGALLGSAGTALPQTVGDAESSLMCSRSAMTLLPGQSLTIQVDHPNLSSLTWSSGERVTRDGSVLVWTPASAPGHYTLHIVAGADAVTSPSCRIDIVVVEGGQLAAPTEPSRHLLTPSEAEAPGFGVYSYLLFSHKPNDDERPVYVRVLEEILHRAYDTYGMRRVLDRKAVNMVYLPVLKTPPANVARGPERNLSAWILDNYDYERARTLLRAFGQLFQDGPYLVAYPVPLSSVKNASSQEGVFDDMATIPTELLPIAVREFVLQTAQERLSDDFSMRRVFFRIRLTLEKLGQRVADGAAALKLVSGLGLLTPSDDKSPAVKRP